VAKLCGCVLCLLLLAAMALPAQSPGLLEIYALIRAEETNNSKIMWLIHEIADVYGPRVTGDWPTRTSSPGRSSPRAPRRQSLAGKIWSFRRKLSRRSTGN
jgi:hypothetical protein